MNPLGISVNENIPLTLTAEQASSTVTLNATGSPTVSGLNYRLGTSGLWLPYTIGTTIPLANVGDCVQFWNSADTLSSSMSNYVQFAMTGQIAGSGILESLINWQKTIPDYCFWNLFDTCGALVAAPDSMGKYLGLRSFSQTYRMTGILSFPRMAMETFNGGSELNSMCFRCYSMSGEVVLPVRTRTNNCYMSAFSQTAITSVKIGLESLTYYDLFNAFYGCSSLSRIEVNFTSWPDASSNSTENWVYGVAASGTFIKPSALPEEYGVNRIPTGWTVVNK